MCVCERVRECEMSVCVCRGGLAIGSTGRIPAGLAANLACYPTFIFLLLLLFIIIIIIIIIILLLLLSLLPAECTKVINSEFAIQ